MGTREAPLGITMTTGAVAVAVCCAVPSAVTGPGINARLGVLAVGFLLFDGFVEGDHGNLVWQGRADLVRVGLLCAAGIIGVAIGALRQWRERLAAVPTPAAPAVPVPRQAAAGDVSPRRTRVHSCFEAASGS
jgi:hypothetical protein